jgi:catalase
MDDRKDRQLDGFRRERDEDHLTTDQGVRVDSTDDSLTLGERGPTLMEDFHFREKMTHFDHERIPERVVHARGSGAYGSFRPHEGALSGVTKAAVFRDEETPVFVRFSTVVGFRGSADTVRDVRGFATKFYTSEGNWDLVGNNMPVFFIQDAIKFPDLVHAIKPEPHHEMPQASAAHDTFWDFVSLTPESMHMIMWVLSDRAIPRSYRMMEGFGVHTFRFVNDEGRATFVKFHWRPALGTHSLVWDEAQKLAGKDPDFNRRDLWEAIEEGSFAEFELCVQLVDERDEHRFDFDLLDPTKLIPVEDVPLEPVGKMVLDRNPDNFHAETEQVAFHVGNVVPGIDFTNDPLLQGRLFSYLDTQLLRLGGPNFTELAVNRPVAPVRTNHHGGFSRQVIQRGRVAYHPNTLAGGCPAIAGADEGAFVHHAERVEGHKVRARSESFQDHFSQATLFWNSMSEAEQQHIVEAAHFELGKVGVPEVRERMIGSFNEVDHDLARRVAQGIGVRPPEAPVRPNHGRRSPDLSQEHRPITAPRGRRVAVVAADGADHAQLAAVREGLSEAGAKPEIVSMFQGTIDPAGDADPVEVDKSYVTTGSVEYDAVVIVGGADQADALLSQGEAMHFVHEAFKHHKPIAAMGEGVDVLRAATVPGTSLAGPDTDGQVVVDAGVVTTMAAQPHEVVTRLVDAIAQHRHWDRDRKHEVPA